MENNLNYKGIETYCDQLSKQIVEQAFGKKQTLSGQDILAISPIKQINLFVIKNLFSEWQKEASKVKSPYFNYEDEQVQQALTTFMNVLSKNIAVDEVHLLPLLKDAIKETILLIFSPYDFYTHQIPSKQTRTIEDLRSFSKYVKINENILKSLLEKLDVENVESVDRKQIVKSLNSVFESTEASPQDVNTYLDEFSKLLPLDEQLIYGEVQSQNDEPLQKNEDEISAHKEEGEAQPVNKKFEKPTKMLNDELGEEPKTSIANIHQKQKINDIDKHLSINQRFMFVRVLFDNDESSFKKTIGHLESLDNRSVAFDYLSEHHPDWDYESEEVEEFLEIVAKRLGE